jgi:hypothetical protein
MNGFASFAMTEGKDEEKKEAERRETQYFMVPHRRMRPRIQRDALASRRSTTALAAANERRRSAPATRFLGRD